MNNQHHDPDRAYRATILTLDGQEIATGSITLGDRNTDGEFRQDRNFSIHDIAKHQKAQAMIEGHIYRLKDFRLCQASLNAGGIGHFDFRLDA